MVNFLSFLCIAFAFGFWFCAIFVSSWLVLSDLDGCNALVSAISTPPNSLGHLILSLWGPEAAGFFIFHVAVSLVGFMLHVGLAVLLYAIHGATVNTLVEDGAGGANNTFCAFNPKQSEKASMVTAN